MGPDAPAPVLVYDRIDANRRNTRLLLGAYVLALLPFVAVMPLMLFVLLGDLMPKGPMEQHPLFVACGVPLTAGIVAIQYWRASRMVLRQAGGRSLAAGEEPELRRSVENLCIGAGLPTPRLHLIDSLAPNALATGRDPAHASLAFTRGLLALLDQRELDAVVAHELSHVGNEDTRLGTLLATAVRTLRLPWTVAAIQLSPLGFVDALFRDEPPSRRLWWRTANLIGLLFLMLGRLAVADQPLLFLMVLYVLTLAPVVGHLLRFAVSRQREFLADADAALLTRDPEGLALALAKIEAAGQAPLRGQASLNHLYIVDPVSSDSPWLDRLFSMHPSIQKRIELLARMGTGIPRERLPRARASVVALGGRAVLFVIIAAIFYAAGGIALLTRPLAPSDLAQEMARGPDGKAGWARILAPEGRTFPFEFLMGCVPDDEGCDYAEKDQHGKRERHPVTLSRPFELMTHEVTVAQYRRFSDATEAPVIRWLRPPTQPEWSDDRHPAVNVSWYEAAAFCKFIGGRLPTEAEWEWAARGGHADWIYPWGKDAADSRDYANSFGRGGRDEWERAAPVGSLRPNGFGLYDMAGNVWEWTSTLSRDYPYKSDDGREGPKVQGQRVVRGGSWDNSPEYLRVSGRYYMAAADRGDLLGLRCARDISP